MARVPQIGEIHHNDGAGNHCKEAIWEKRGAARDDERSEKRTRGLVPQHLYCSKKTFRRTSFKMQFTEPVDSDEKSSVVEKLSSFAGSLSIGQGSNDPFFFSMTMYPPRATINSTPNPPV